jgi:hypothetical protein
VEIGLNGAIAQYRARVRADRNQGDRDLVDPIADPMLRLGVTMQQKLKIGSRKRLASDDRLKSRGTGNQGRRKDKQEGDNARKSIHKCNQPSARIHSSGRRWEGPMPETQDSETPDLT